MKKENQKVENSTNVEPTVEAKVVNLDSLKAELKLQAEKMAEAKAELAAKLKELKEQAKALKEEEKTKKEEIKKQEAEERASKMKEALAKAGLELQVNKTQRIKELLIAGKTVDEMVIETGFARKEILDRVWLIEKRLGIR